jgi:hypothetical protein
MNYERAANSLREVCRKTLSTRAKPDANVGLQHVTIATGGNHGGHH